MKITRRLLTAILYCCARTALRPARASILRAKAERASARVAVLGGRAGVHVWVW